MAKSFPEAKLRVRMSSHDAHYAGNLVDGARILNLFGDLATELTIRYDGDEGLLRAYDNVEYSFLGRSDPARPAPRSHSFIQNHYVVFWQNSVHIRNNSINFSFAFLLKLHMCQMPLQQELEGLKHHMHFHELHLWLK